MTRWTPEDVKNELRGMSTERCGEAIAEETLEATDAFLDALAADPRAHPRSLRKENLYTGRTDDGTVLVIWNRPDAAVRFEGRDAYLLSPAGAPESSWIDAPFRVSRDDPGDMQGLLARLRECFEEGSPHPQSHDASVERNSPLIAFL